MYLTTREGLFSEKSVPARIIYLHNRVKYIQNVEVMKKIAQAESYKVDQLKFF